MVKAKGLILLSLMMALMVSCAHRALSEERHISSVNFAQEFESFDIHYRLEANKLNIDNQQGLSVLWWNIDCGTAAIKINGDNIYTSDLEKNLWTLVNSKLKPEVLMLGEFCPYYLDKKFVSALEKLYKSKHHLVRNIPQFKTSSGKTNERNGFLVLSDYKLSLVKETTLFGNAKLKEGDKSNRKYLLLSIVKNQVTYYLNPVHLYNPWREVRNSKGIFGTLDEISKGEDNPNARQGQQLVNLNTNLVDPQARLLVIGDFNSPKSFYAIDGYVFKLMSKNFVNLVDDMSETFVNGNSFMTASIDHAFGQNITPYYAYVWPFRGSGHLPLYIVFK